MKKILVLSDTHMPKKANTLPDVLTKPLTEVDLIIHAGDWQTTDVYEELKKYAPVIGVYGNVDSDPIKELVKDKEIIEVEGYEIGITHGHGERGTTEKRVLGTFEKDELDMIIFGHSHLPYLKFYKKTLLFNPGSPTDKRKLPFYSYGLLTIDGGIEAKHVFF
ncbi:metallophosphoesterase [Bacillaceae bacterium S4-13-56]